MGPRSSFLRLAVLVTCAVALVFVLAVPDDSKVVDLVYGGF